MMENLTFKLINCDDIEVEFKYALPTDYLSLVDHGNDEETWALPALDDEVTEMKYFGNYISLKQNSINTVLDVYNYCCQRESTMFSFDIVEYEKGIVYAKDEAEAERKVRDFYRNKVKQNVDSAEEFEFYVSEIIRHEDEDVIVTVEW